MDDWKNRLVEEYHQLKERWEKLKNHNKHKEIVEILDACPHLETLEERKQERKVSLRRDLMRSQQSSACLREDLRIENWSQNRKFAKVPTSKIEKYVSFGVTARDCAGITGRFQLN